MICIVNKDRTINYANQALTDFLGKSKQELIGGYAFGAIGCVNSWPDGANCGFGEYCGNCSLRTVMQKCFESGTSFYNQEQRMRLIIQGIPKEIVFLISGAYVPHYNTQEFNTPKLLFCLQNITHLKDTEESFLQLQKKAQIEAKEKAEVLAFMSHELRTPLNAIIGYSQLLEMDELQKATQNEYVSEILKAGKYLLELINQVLELSKIEGAAVEIFQEPIVCSEIIDECVSIVKLKAKKRNIKIFKKVPTKTAVYADKKRLKQVIINLLSNAVKYNCEGGSIWIDALVVDDRLRVLFKDTGIGVPLDRLHELFKPFKRLEMENSEIEGTGIGLNICKKLMELMGGSIGLENSSTAGSTFFIDIPVSNKKTVSLL